MKASQYTPQTPDERIEGISVLLPLPGRNGFVFLVAKTQKITPDVEDLMQFLSDQVHRLTESFGSDTHVQQRFEQFLGSINESLAQSIKDGRWNIPVNQLDALIGIACDHQMFLSGTGDLCALFLHRKQQRYQVFNLFRSIQTEQSLPTWEKAFAVVLDGDLEDGDVFLISNQDLQRAIPADDLNTILTTLPPTGATEKVRQYFSERTPLLLIVIKMISQQEPAYTTSGRATLKTEVSVNQFKEQEDLTQHLLADQTPKLSTLIAMLHKNWKRLKEQKIWPFLASRARKFLWNFLKTLTHLKSTEGRVETKSQVVGQLKKTQKRVQSFFYSFSRIPKTTKLLSVGIVTVILVLTISISFLSTSRAEAVEQKSYEELIVKIDDLIERADGAVIYKDENQARGLYLSASALIDQLPATTPERVQTIATYKENLQKSTDGIRHLVSVPNPALLGDIGALTDGVFGQSFVKVGSEFYVYTSDGRVYQLDRGPKTFHSVSSQIDGSRIAKSASADGNQIFALMSDQSITQYTVDQADQKNVELNKPNADMIDLLAYASRLYILTLTESDGQIYRFNKSEGKFSNGTNWITSKTTSLVNARALTIDGSLFVLQKNGQIEQFDSGSEVGFDTGIVDPPITNATQIWTDSNSAYLYVLEPDTKRVIVFDKKTGAFIVQYKSEAFQNLSDIIVDESAYSIYLLSGSKIYSIAPSHIAR